MGKRKSRKKKLTKFVLRTIFSLITEVISFMYESGDYYVVFDVYSHVNDLLEDSSLVVVFRL